MGRLTQGNRNGAGGEMGSKKMGAKRRGEGEEREREKQVISTHSNVSTLSKTDLREKQTGRIPE